MPPRSIGRDAGQRRRLPGGGIILYLHRAGRLLLDGGNELPQLAFPFRAEDVRPHQRQTAARGHLRPADETGHHHQPQQVRAGRFGQRQVILHEPLGTAILRTRNAHRIGGHGGNSYEGLCSLIHQKTGGEDGIYFTYTDEHPIAFNPFFTDDRVFDIEKRESIKTLLLTLWKKDNEPATRSEEVALSNAVSLYIERIKGGEEEPSFNTFYEFVKSEYRRILEEKQVRRRISTWRAS